MITEPVEIVYLIYGKANFDDYESIWATTGDYPTTRCYEVQKSQPNHLNRCISIMIA